jgi:hypothetical protein
VDDVAEVLAVARDAYRRHDWAVARERFTAARAAGGELAAGDLEALADAAWWLGELDEASAVLEEAFRRHLEEGRPGPAAGAALGIAVNHFLRGDGVVGSAGWVAPSGCCATSRSTSSTATSCTWSWRVPSATPPP